MGDKNRETPCRPPFLRPEIVVDDRERVADLAGEIKRAVGHAPAIARLRVGDVMIGDRFVVERKEAADFIASLLENRLEAQLHALAAARPLQPVFIIEGTFNPATLGGLSGGAVREVLLSIQMDWRIPVLSARDIGETAGWIATLTDRIGGRTKAGSTDLSFAPAPRRERHNPRQLRTKRRGGIGTEALQMARLRQIPGLGAIRAAELLRRFGSIHRLLSATEETLAETPGIGPGLARAIREALGGRSVSDP